MTYTDIEIVCAECHRPFVFSGRDQRFYFEHDLQVPRRCKACRAAKRRRDAEHEWRRAFRA